MMMRAVLLAALLALVSGVLGDPREVEVNE